MLLDTLKLENKVQKRQKKKTKKPIKWHFVLRMKDLNLHIRKCQECWNVEVRRYKMFRVRSTLAVIGPNIT